MPFTPTVRDAMLNAILGLPAVAVATHASLHSAIPDETGSNEISGGSPAYARLPIAFTPASNGRLVKSASPAVQFNVPSATTVAYVGLWTSAVGGVFLQYSPVSGDPLNVALASSATNDLSAPGHGLLDNDRLLVSAFTGLSTPPGLPPGVYFVVNSAPNAFKLASVLDGTPIDITADGVIVYQRIRIDVFSSQGTLTVSSLTLGLDG